MVTQIRFACPQCEQTDLQSLSAQDTKLDCSHCRSEWAIPTGAIKDAPLNIPGVELEGSYGAADFVNWYDSHPDFPLTWPLDAKEVAVIGNGNVAMFGFSLFE